MSNVQVQDLYSVVLEPLLINRGRRLLSATIVAQHHTTGAKIERKIHFDQFAERLSRAFAFDQQQSDGVIASLNNGARITLTGELPSDLADRAQLIALGFNHLDFSEQ